MHVAVDAAGQHQQARHIDDLARRAEVGPECGDPPVLDPDIAGEGVGGRRHRPAADDRVECHR